MQTYAYRIDLPWHGERDPIFRAESILIEWEKIGNQ